MKRNKAGTLSDKDNTITFWILSMYETEVMAIMETVEIEAAECIHACATESTTMIQFSSPLRITLTIILLLLITAFYGDHHLITIEPTEKPAPCPAKTTMSPRLIFPS